MMNGHWNKNEMLKMVLENNLKPNFEIMIKKK